MHKNKGRRKTVQNEKKLSIVARVQTLDSISIVNYGSRVVLLAYLSVVIATVGRVVSYARNLFYVPSRLREVNI